MPIPERRPFPRGDFYDGELEIYMLPPIPSINGDRMNEIMKVTHFHPDQKIVLHAFRVKAGNRNYIFGYCLGDAEGISAIGIGVVERMLAELPATAPLCIRPIRDKDTAWDQVLHDMRTFNGEALLITFPNSIVYDAGSLFVDDKGLSIFIDGKKLQKRTRNQRRQTKKLAAKLRGDDKPPTFYPVPGIDREEEPPIFEFKASNGKTARITVWNGRKNYIHDMPNDIIRLVGGDRIAIIQVSSPVGVDGRSSIEVNDRLVCGLDIGWLKEKGMDADGAEVFSGSFDGIIHWARDIATYQSIVSEFMAANLPSVSPPDNLPEVWSPQIVMVPEKG